MNSGDNYLDTHTPASPNLASSPSGHPQADPPTQPSTKGAIIPAHVGRSHTFSGPDIRRFPQMAIHDLGVVARRKRPGDFENCTNISLRNRYVYFAVD